MKPILYFFVALVLTQPVLADDLARNNLIERLEATSTLQASFIQRTLKSNKQVIEESSGILTISRPMKFVWEVISPAPQQLISNGETLWVYDPDLEQATFQAISDQLLQSPAMILAQPQETLTTQYDVQEAGDDTLVAFRLFPKDENALFAELTILYRNNIIYEIRILDELDQQTLISFTDVDYSFAVEDAFFEFQAPDGTDMFEQM